MWGNFAYYPGYDRPQNKYRGNIKKAAKKWDLCHSQKVQSDQGICMQHFSTSNSYLIYLSFLNWLQNVYLAKNMAEVVVAIICLVTNIRLVKKFWFQSTHKWNEFFFTPSFALVPSSGASPCEVPVQSFPGLVNSPGMVHFQCRGKKMSFFALALWVHIVLLGMHLILSIGAIIWCWKFR